MASKRKTVKEEPLNLIPVMNLVTILIPFLLMAAEFVSLAVIDSTLPAIGAPQPPDPNQQEDEEPPLQLSLAITAKGVRVLGADKVLFPDGAPELAEGEEAPPTVPCVSGGSCTSVDDYNWSELTRILAKVKDTYPDDENVIIVPDTKISYEVIVATMDASREDKESTGADGKYRTLFPFVVIAGGAM
jgi:biopolymer transport protein ExbD